MLLVTLFKRRILQLMPSTIRIDIDHQTWLEMLDNG